MPKHTSHRRALARIASAALALAFLALACMVQTPQRAEIHRWWGGLGPVLPHETFPSDCKLCHTGAGWHELVPEFAYDHAAETGVPLEGAHAAAQCLRCHNDRGPVSVFASQGCAGCHEDIHVGQLGDDCESCHVETTWQPYGQIERHLHTRFPLTGVHAVTACHRCHPGGEVGRFVPTDIECVTCHASDLAAAVNPNHIGLGWVDNCDRCHLPMSWNQAELD